MEYVPKSFEENCKKVNWLKSLSPQSRWKPNKKQIRSLEYAINKDRGNIELEGLESLYKQLKAL